MKKTAIILGASGLTGSIVLEKLLNDDRYDTIKLFSRKRIDGLPSKVKQYIGDLKLLKKILKGMMFFVVLGQLQRKLQIKLHTKLLIMEFLLQQHLLQKPIKSTHWL